MSQIQNITEIIKFGLENLDTLSEGSKQIYVKNVYIINEDTLCCDFYSFGTNSIDIKMEIVTIMGFFNGFFRNDGFEGINFSYYAVKAFDKNNVELIYAISSKATAELIGKGNSIDWLKSTLFQESTDDYRLSQSKRIIAEIENCLRELVKTKLNEQFGYNWWDISLDNKLGKEVKQMYFNQFGIKCDDGNILISYTYTLQLKKIISTHFKLFKPYFDNLVDFDNQMDNLNKIRREEAHNRNISEKNLNDLNDLHERLTARTLLELTSFQSGYLTENWKLKIKKIMVQGKYKPIYNEQEITNESDLPAKLQKIKQNIEHLISYLNDTIVKLKSISAPVHKKTTQRDLINVFEKFKDLQVELLNSSISLNEEDIKKTVSKIAEHKKVMDSFAGNFLLVET